MLVSQNTKKQRGQQVSESREVHFDVGDIEFQNVGVASEEGTDAEPDIEKKKKKKNDQEN